MLWTFYIGIGSATVTRVGKRIGAGNEMEAKLVGKIVFILSLIVCGSISLILVLISEILPLIYTKDPKVQLIMTECIQLLSVLYIFGSIGWVAANILEAMSRNKGKALLNATISWLVYVPICIYLISKENSQRLFNMNPVPCIFLVGIVIEVIRAIILWVMVWNTDWKKCCIEAANRNNVVSYEKVESDILENNIESMCDM